MFYADLHVHSKFSRATSKDCTLEQLAYWARRKGLTVIGTGDFTHPAWFCEIKEKLIPAEPGLFRLRSDLEKEIEQRLAPSCRGPIRFMLEVEISTIYKKADRVRKIHHMIYVPDFEKAGHIIQRLSRIGNLKSDGRPILGLNSRDLLEITLEAGEGSYLIPAHIWTPWFSMLGSKSGFDTINECYEDLSSYIFALETGLSSDPAMNWRLSSLDRYRLVSNSDAHSPPKLGREACVFDTEMDYFSMRSALETGKGYNGTVEFFPEEGKYHLDGHRKCGIRFSPEETKENNGICPVCGKTVTVGVMHRVNELADRPPYQGPPPAADTVQGKAPFRSFVPLSEVLSEIFAVGPNTNKVRKAYSELISRLGAELFILEHAPIDDIRRVCSSIFAEAIARMREGRVIREAGFDGEYGTIRLFEEKELRSDKSMGLLFELPSESASMIPASPSSPREIIAAKPTRRVSESRATFSEPEPLDILDNLDPDQRLAAEIIEAPLLITAGPGTGKTRTLTHRIAHLIANHGVSPEQCLAITFTRRAASEMQERLQRLLPDKAAKIPVMTFHALGYTMLCEHGDRLDLPQPFRVAGDLERTNLLMETLSIPLRSAKRLLTEISELKRAGIELQSATNGSQAQKAGSDITHALNVYHREMRSRSLLDFDDLIELPVKLLGHHPDLVAHYHKRYPWISIDEYQDINECQYHLIKLLVGADGHICAIGDPDQAIYGFRGTDVRFFQQFTNDFSNARTVQLTKNYRSGKMIVKASMQVIAPSSLVEGRTIDALLEDTTKIMIHESATEQAEAEFVVHAIERLIGGSTFFSMDSGRVETDDGEILSFSDFGVLYRTDAQSEALCEAFARSGMPFQKRSHISLCDSPLVQSMISIMREMPKKTAITDRLDQAVAEFREKESRDEVLLITRALRPLAERYGNDLEGFLSEMAMGLDVDLWDPKADCISLLTLHASKGLEFPVVFMVGCEDGILPLRWGSSGDVDIDEERRLFFVGMTRARERLFLCHARKRLLHGKHQQMQISPFLRDIQEELLERSITRFRKKRSPAPHEQLSFF